jgi:hypothetical protein
VHAWAPAGAAALAALAPAPTPRLTPPRPTPAGVPADSPARARLVLAEKATLVAFRLLPHALIALVVAFSPRAFSSLLYWLLALAGMVTCNAVNAHKASRLLVQSPQPPAGSSKAHGE